MEESDKVDLVKLKSIVPLRYKGQPKIVKKDDRGSREIHHEDGRVDAVVNPPSISLTVKPHEGK